jgi:dTDP-4-dehydrorhamnose 3,5-epimerase
MEGQQMKASPTALHGVIIVEPQVFGDQRGWFMETYSRRKMDAIGITSNFVQDNHSFSAAKGTVRGLHYQREPHAQAKLVRCTKGAILDVAVDIRQGSPQYGQWVGVELTADNHRMLFVPRGFAHGFVTLLDETEVQYKVDNLYDKDSEGSIRFDDADIGIKWGVEKALLSEKDAQAPTFQRCNNNFRFEC